MCAIHVGSEVSNRKLPRRRMGRVDELELDREITSGKELAYWQSPREKRRLRGMEESFEVMSITENGVTIPLIASRKECRRGDEAFLAERSFAEQYRRTHVSETRKFREVTRALSPSSRWRGWGQVEGQGARSCSATRHDIPLKVRLARGWSSRSP